MKKAHLLTGFVLLLLVASGMPAQAQEKVSATKARTVLNQLNLNYPGLETVQYLAAQHNYTAAAKALLDYYRNRKGIRLPEYNRDERASYQGKPLPAGVQEKADSGMVHVFFVHEGYGYKGKGYFNYGKDINWQNWPVKDNEVRWQLHRMYWWIPMGLAYWSTGKERYAKEWVLQYRDWIKDNPLGLSANNDRFAWRPLETSRRVQDQTALFNFFIGSPHFTPAFLIAFLANYQQHVEHVLKNYSERGNHLLFEAQRILYGGCFFPEFKRSADWRKSGIAVLNKEIQKQVYPDGLQYELSPNYHIASINIFLKALRITQLNGFEGEFPSSYRSTIKNMIAAVADFSFPDYTYPMFGDAKLADRQGMLQQYAKWQKVFPKSSFIRYFATAGEKGLPPSHLSKGLTTGGFYTFRNGWTDTATVLVLRASPPAFFHSQPDNGTFELWSRGRNFMPDAGCYVYSGNAEIQKLRNWYRQTRVHQTLTLDNKNMQICKARLQKWETRDSLDVLIYANPSYEGLTHRRTVLFIDKTFFVLIDEAIGSATGDVALHYQLAPHSRPAFGINNAIHTRYSDGNNLLIQCFAPESLRQIREEGKVSYHYRETEDRPAFAFVRNKNDKKTLHFLTVLCPYEGKSPPKVQLLQKPKSEDLALGQVSFKLSINGKAYPVNVQYTAEKPETF